MHTKLNSVVHSQNVNSRKFISSTFGYCFLKTDLNVVTSALLRAVSTVFSTWLSEYPEDFKSLGEPSLLLHLAQLLPQDSSSAVELRAHVLRIAEELSEKALLPDMHKGLCFASVTHA